MNEILLEKILLKFDQDLINYKYVSLDELNIIPENCKIKYIKKNSSKLKTGFLKSIKENMILELYFGSRKWHVYANQYIIFYKFKNESKLKIALQKMLDTNFTNLTIEK
jgi:hypothetical protein